MTHTNGCWGKDCPVTFSTGLRCICKCHHRPDVPHRNGETYVHERDGARLNRQHKLVFDCMQDGDWRTLQAISEETGAPEPSVSARLRDFRKVRFGGHTVERIYLGDGLFAYRLIIKGTSYYEEAVEGEQDDL